VPLGWAMQAGCVVCLFFGTYVLLTDATAYTQQTCYTHILGDLFACIRVHMARCERASQRKQGVGMSIVRAREYEYARPHTHACFYTHCFRAWASTASWSNYSTLLCPSCYKLVPVKHAVFAPRTFLQIRGLAVETTRTRTVKKPARTRKQEAKKKRREGRQQTSDSHTHTGGLLHRTLCTTNRSTPFRSLHRPRC